MSVDWQTAPYANGPKVAAWVRPRLKGMGGELDYARRTVSEWERGAQATFYAIDRILTRLDLHPQDLPADVWEATRKKAPNVSREQAQEIRESGLPPKAAARRFGISPATVTRIKRGTHPALAGTLTGRTG